MSAARPSSRTHISKTYRQASTLFLTRRLPEALSTVLPLVTPPAPASPTSVGDGRTGSRQDGQQEPAPVARASRTTRVKVWSLYLTILNAVVELGPDEGKEAFGSQDWRAICNKVREGGVWEEVVRNGYHGVEGNVDSDVVINLATLLLAHARTQALNQKRLESYLATANTPDLNIGADHFSTSLRADGMPPSPSPSRRYRSPAKRAGAASGTDTPRDLNSRVKILELYTLHVLLRNNEWDYAREFISMSSVLDEERREAFLQALQHLQEEQQATDQHEQEGRREREELLRHNMDEGRLLRAENQEREKKLLEKEQARAVRERERGSGDDGGGRSNRSVSGLSNEDKPDDGIGHGKAARSGVSVEGSRVGAGGPARPGVPSPSTSNQKGKPATPPPSSLATRAATVLGNVRALMVESVGASLRSSPLLMLRVLAFAVGLLVLLGRRKVRERITRVLGASWAKALATAGMGVKVSYI